MGWGKFRTGGVKGGKLFTPGVKVIIISQQHRRLFPSDAIGFLVLAGKSMEEWLNTIESRLSIVMNQGF